MILHTSNELSKQGSELEIIVNLSLSFSFSLTNGTTYNIGPKVLNHFLSLEITYCYRVHKESSITYYVGFVFFSAILRDHQY